MPKLTRKQTGSKNKKDITRKGKKMKRTLNPWGGPNKPAKFNGSGTVQGSSTRKSNPSPQLSPQTKGYPGNQPSQWPIEPDYVNHTLPPPLSGMDQDYADTHNAAVNHAFTRAGY